MPQANTSPADRLIVALDLPGATEALAMVDRLSSRCKWFKIGLELFCAAGPDLVREMRHRDLHVFLDLKLHDIPNTVASAVRSLTQLDVQMLTVHAGGGSEMLAAAQEAAGAPGAPALLAVTVLTSMDATALYQVGVPDAPEAQVLRLAKLTASAHLPGLVCSSHEVESLRHTLGPEPIIVVPGIRPRTASLDDQRRVATPGEALSRGASMLVVGRPILRAPDPSLAAAAILEEISADL